ncbi:MAG TPA: PAS domain S-box protein [Longimicrobium sp.]|jgi:PAS domain S-box-containing protein
MDHGTPDLRAPDAGDELYRGLFERIPVGVYRTTPDGRYLDANPALVRLTGWPSREELLRTRLDDIWADPAERGRWQEMMERDGVVRDFEFLHRRYDGGAVWVRETARALRDEAGDVVCYEGVVEDVTERRAAEDRLRFQAQLLAGVRESVIANDLAGNITYWNEAAAEMFGWTAAEALGRHIVDTCPAPEVRDAAAGILARIAGGGRWAGEFLARRRSGEVFPILLNVAPTRDAAGRVNGCVGVCSDLTRQKREEEAQRFLAEAGAVLASSLEYQATLASVVRMAVPALADFCFVDLVGDDGAIHRLASAHVDPGKDELARELGRWPQCPHGPTVSARVIRAGQTWFVPEIGEAALEEMSAHADHVRILRALDLLSGIAVPLVARGRTLGVLRFATTRAGGRRYGPDDVRLAEELARGVALAVDNARLYAEAQEALEAREQVLRVVSHDLRNPLGAVVAHADMLLEEADAPPEVRREWAGTLRGAAGQMTRMIRDLMDAAQLQSGRLSIEPAPCPARALVLEAVQMLRPLAAERGQRLDFDAPEGLPDVHADRERVLQVLSNLVGNAVKFTPRGGEVVVRARQLGAQVAFSVADTGPGLADEELERVFEPFWRGRRAGRDGLGLGLAIARWLVEAHGGTLRAANGGEGGAVFEFTLPVAAARAGRAA